MTCPPDTNPFAPEVITHDDAVPCLILREQAADALRQLVDVLDPAARAGIARDLSRTARLELAIVNSREAVACREVLAAIETALGVPA